MPLRNAISRPRGYPSGGLARYAPMAGSGWQVARNVYQGAVRAMRTGRALARAANRASESYRRKVPGKKKSATKVAGVRKHSYTSVVNALSTRAAMKMKGKKNQKVKAKRTVKVSKRLREKVKKVIAGSQKYGQYTTIRNGTIGTYDSGSSGVPIALNQSYGPYTLNIGYFPAQTYAAACRWWFGGMLSNRTGFNPGFEFAYFTPQKILDAASVVWNKKAISSNYALVTDNLQGLTTTATGDPVVGTVSAPRTRGVVVRIINSFVSFELKNNSQRTMKVIIWNCVPKVKFPNTSPLSAFLNGSGIVGDTATEDNTYRGYSGTVNNGYENIIFNPYASPTAVDQFKASWKASKMEMVMAPGETCTHSIQGPKNYDLDYDKLVMGGTDYSGFYYKDTTVCCMIAVVPDLALLTVGDGGVMGSGRFTYRSNVAPTAAGLQTGISMEVVETYKMSVPENVGFIDRDNVDGTVQQLNLRKRKIVFANFSPQNAQNNTYNRYDEENPAAGTAQGITN